MSSSHIPKIIHQIAPKDVSTWHPFWLKCHESWKQNFPDYEFKVWGDKEEINDFVKLNYPQFFNLYNVLPFHIMKIDYVRLFLLHKFGGIYAVMDIFCYKNFSDYLKKDIYFLENTTNEFTDACYENSMMASAPNHKLIEELFKYTKVSFLHFRNQIDTTSASWRTDKNSYFINNSTGSGMISAGVNWFKKNFDIGVFECRLFNNRPASYDPIFITKHIHTNIWGKDYLNMNLKKEDQILNKVIIVNGRAHTMTLIDKNLEKDLKKQNIDFLILDANEFDFYYDYTNGKYLKENNLEELKQQIQMW